ncbi:hypothetical protein SAMN04487969_11844 [Paenibacillus algorifonticola]|uniref:Uncharacterized protein n=1 Tax=Paenibacillus algorifonticola TaxID=684063 RepID=A0A1I2GUQ9_9BACL|nr:hypothetical protein [Paenibacillus algorifonticola]SFF20958.1 hypothetical protein SAMN04487969_11844 [Paenibacillus algorifonticola]
MHKSFYIIWTIIILLIGSILLGYLINKTLLGYFAPMRTFPTEQAANTEVSIEATPAFEEEASAFEDETYSPLSVEEYWDNEAEEERPEQVAEMEGETGTFKIWDDLDDLQATFNEAALLMYPSIQLGEITVKEGSAGSLFYNYYFSDTHKLDGIINPVDGSIGRLTIHIPIDATPETLDYFLNTIHIAVAAANPLSKINTNVEDILISLLYEDSNFDYYNMDNWVEEEGITYSISSVDGHGIWFNIYESPK